METVKGRGAGSATDEPIKGSLLDECSSPKEDESWEYDEVEALKRFRESEKRLLTTRKERKVLKEREREMKERERELEEQERELEETRKRNESILLRSKERKRREKRRLEKEREKEERAKEEEEMSKRNQKGHEWTVWLQQLQEKIDNGEVDQVERIIERFGTEKKRKNRRRSTFRTNFGRIELDDEQISETETENGRSATEFLIKTEAQKPPELPKITKLDDAGFIKLEEDYRAYVAECQAKGFSDVKPIRFSIVDDEENKLLSEFLYGHLDRLPGEDRNIDDEHVWEKIRKANSRLPQDKRDLCLTTLKEAVAEQYDETLDNVKARMGKLKSAVVRHLYKGRCLDGWKSKKEEEHKGAREVIVKAVVNALKPPELKNYIKLELTNNKHLNADHHAVFKRIERVGDDWELQRQRTKAAEEFKKNELELSNKRNGVDAKVASVEPTRNNLVEFEWAHCLNCCQRGHYFLRYNRTSGEWEQNCPRTCQDYKEKKRLALKQIKSKGILKEQEQNRKRQENKKTRNDLIADLENRILWLKKRVESKEISRNYKEKQEKELEDIKRAYYEMFGDDCDQQAETQDQDEKDVESYRTSIMSNEGSELVSSKFTKEVPSYKNRYELLVACESDSENEE